MNQSLNYFFLYKMKPAKSEKNKAPVSTSV